MALGAPARHDEIAQAGQQHGGIDLDVDELHGIHIGKREQEGADRRKGGRDAEVPHREAAEAEEPDRRKPRHHDHVGREGIDAEEAQRRMSEAEQQEAVRIAERAAGRIEDQQVGPMHRAREHVTPMLDQGEREVAVLLVAEGAVEA